MYEEKQWFAHFDDVKLVYLSPSQEVVTQQLEHKLIAKPGTRPNRRRRAKQEVPTIEESADSIKDIGWDCLENIQWASTDATGVEH